jgi:uncharacterized membrane protein YhfC
MLHFTFVVEILFIIGLPVGLWLWLRRRTNVSWGLIAAGAITFVLSQVLHTLLLLGIQALVNQSDLQFLEPSSAAAILINATVLGLAAGVCEEPVRYLALRFWRREARSWEQGIAFGAGHGGAEAILLGLSVLITFVSMIALQNLDLASLAEAGELLGVEEQIAAQLDAYWSTPWYLPLLGAAERAFAITLHIAWALVVVRAITHNNLGWLGVAILGHALVDGVAVGLMQAGVSFALIEGVLLLFALVGLFTILKLRSTSQPEETPPDEGSPIQPA